MANLMRPFARAWNQFYRRMWSAAPTSVTPESALAWEQRQYRYYATQQPYASPLSIAYGNLTGETWEMRRAYRDWSFREPACKAALLTKCLAVCQLTPSVKASDANDKQDVAAAAWVKYALGASAEGFPGLIFNMTVGAIIDGFSVVEPVWGHVDERNNQYPNWWKVDQFASIDTQFTRFRLDTYRQVIGVQSISGAQGAQFMNPEDFIIFTHLKLFENPFGMSDLRAAVRACRLIESAIRLRDILLKNFSGPFLWASAKDANARASILAVIQNSRANGYIVVPEGCELQVENLATSAPDQFRAAIEDYRQEIVTAIQGAYLQLLEGKTVDGRGNTQVHAGIAELFIWWLSTWVCQVINVQLIPSLVIPMFGSSVGFPQLQLGAIDEDEVAKRLDNFKRGLDMGMTLSRTQAMEAGGFESPKDKSDELKMLPPTGDSGDPFGNVFAPSGGTATDTFPDGQDGNGQAVDQTADTATAS